MDNSAPSTTNSRVGKRWILGVLAAGVLVAITAVVLIDRADETSTVDASGDDGRGPKSQDGGWTRLPDPPLSPRVGASATWTGKEILVVGGWEFLCPPGADCAGPTEAPFTDGAAFDPSSQTWRPIATAPAAFEGEHPAVAAGSVFFLVECDFEYLGTAESPAEDRCPNSDAPSLLLRYDPDRDTWHEFPGPPGEYPLEIQAVGDSIIAFAGTEERGEQSEWHFDLDSATWAELPPDPLPLMYDRSIVATDGGRSALLFGADAESGPTSEPSQEVNLAARLDLESMTWTERPSSPSRGYRAWGVEDVVVLEPHFGGNGGIFHPVSSSWSALTAGADEEAFDSNQVAGVFGPAEAVYVDAAGWAFDVERKAWLEIPPIDDRSVFPNSSVTAVGRDLFSFGGERWTSSDGELLGDAWMWIAPSASSSSSTTTSSAPDPTSTTSSSAPTTSTPTARVPTTTLSEVTYTCGPSDTPVVSMRLAAEKQSLVSIEVTVLNEVVGSTPNVEIGVQATTREVEIDLSAEEYDHGEGLVSVRGPDNAVLTTAPVTLRMTNGGCG